MCVLLLGGVRVGGGDKVIARLMVLITHMRKSPWLLLTSFLSHLSAGCNRVHFSVCVCILPSVNNSRRSLFLSNYDNCKCQILHSNWALSSENVSSEIFEQVRFKPAYSATEAS